MERQPALFVWGVVFASLAVALACARVEPAPGKTAAVAPTPIPVEVTATPPAPTVPPTDAPSPTPTAPSPTPDVTTRWTEAGWLTDFNRHSVPLSQIRSGGPPRDGIPPIDQPRFISVSEADGWLKPKEPVISLTVNGVSRAYPLQILTWHEIVNDTIGGVPVAVTFCPLCNTGIAFDRRVGDRVLDFGTTGLLRYSDLVMWDRQTESWWQQITGEAIVGELTGTQLVFLPAAIVAWQDFAKTYPNGEVLSRDTGYRRDYGRNPYTGYDDVGNVPFLYEGPMDGRVAPMERVVGLTLGDQAVAFRFRDLTEHGVAHATVGGQPVVVFHRPGTASALDKLNIAASRDIGSAAAYSPVLDGRTLEFALRNGQIVDTETGSAWDIHGRAVSGLLAGQRLEPIVHANHFWFAVSAFYPQIEVWKPE